MGVQRERVEAHLVHVYLGDWEVFSNEHYNLPPYVVQPGLVEHPEARHILEVLCARPPQIILVATNKQTKQRGHKELTAVRVSYKHFHLVLFLGRWLGSTNLLLSLFVLVGCHRGEGMGAHLQSVT